MSITASDVNIYAPTASSTVAVATAASTFTSVASMRRVWIKSSVDAHICFGTTAAATVVTTTNVYVTAGQDYVFDRSTTSAGASDAGFKVKKTASASTGTLWYASV